MKNYIFYSILIFIFGSCSEEKGNKLNNKNTKICFIDTTTFKIKKEVLNECKLFVYFLNEKYHVPNHFIINKSDTLNVPFRQVSLCENIRPYRNGDMKEYILWFNYEYRDSTISKISHLGSIHLDTSYQMQYIVLDGLDVSLKDAKIQPQDIIQFQKAVLEDKNSDQWLRDNVEKATCLLKY